MSITSMRKGRTDFDVTPGRLQITVISREFIATRRPHNITL